MSRRLTWVGRKGQEPVAEVKTKLRRFVYQSIPQLKIMECKHHIGIAVPVRIRQVVWNMNIIALEEPRPTTHARLDEYTQTVCSSHGFRF